MADVEVCLELRGLCRPVGIMRRHAARGSERVTFTYAEDWTSSPTGFAIDPALPLGAGTFRPTAGHVAFGAVADSAPDSWGRSLMRRRERREAEREGRSVRALQETDFLLGVSDEARLGALRFRHRGDHLFQAPQETAIPGMIVLGRLRNAAERVLQGAETDEDLLAIFAPGIVTWRSTAEGIGDRPPRRAVDCQVSQGIRRILAGTLGGDSARLGGSGGYSCRRARHTRGSRAADLRVPSIRPPRRAADPLHLGPVHDRAPRRGTRQLSGDRGRAHDPRSTRRCGPGRVVQTNCVFGARVEYRRPSAQPRFPALGPERLEPLARVRHQPHSA